MTHEFKPPNFMPNFLQKQACHSWKPVAATYYCDVLLCVCVPHGLVLSVPGFLSRGERNELCSCAAKLLLPRVTEVYRNVKEELNRVRV